MFKGRGKEKVKPSTQKTEPLNAVNKNKYTLCTKEKGEMKFVFNGKSQPGLHTGTESHPN